MAETAAVTVYKLGGSLLELPDLVPRLNAVLHRPSSQPLLVVGGGAAADLVRRWDGTHNLGHRRAHWLAFRAMALNERLLESLLPDAQVVSNRDQAAAVWGRRGLPILCALDVLQAESDFKSPGADARRLAGLPENWDVTSDSIAAHVAVEWRADELVLIKSRGKPDGGIAEAAAAGCVDAHFVQAARSLPRIGWVNLRDDSPRIHRWIDGDQSLAGVVTC